MRRRAPSEAEAVAPPEVPAPEAPPEPPLFDDAGNLFPEPTILHELISMHPMAYAKASAWLLSIAAVGAIILVADCAGLLLDGLWYEDLILRLSCAARVVLAIPRPYGWWNIWKLHIEAGRQTTGLRIAQKCLAALDSKFVVVNHRLSRVYECWLAGVIAWCGLRLLFVDQGSRSEFEQALLFHAQLCVAFLVAQKLLGSLIILGLLYWGQGETMLYRNALDLNSSLSQLTETSAAELAADPCIICFGDFAVDESVRHLGNCNHVFHQECIDEWLLASRPRSFQMTGIKCPVCSAPIQCDTPDDDDDPKTVRELAWLIELQQRQAMRQGD